MTNRSKRPRRVYANGVPLKRCRWHGCQKNAVGGHHLEFCSHHITKIQEAEAEARTNAGLLNKCTWPACVDYALLGQPVRFCAKHIAIVMYHGGRHPAVYQIVEDMIGSADEPEPKREQQPVQGHVYFLLSDNLVKIGWTSDLDKRMKQYSPGARILAVKPGIKEDEARLHKKFGHLKTNRREWFTYSPQVMEEVERVVEEHGEPPRELNEPMTTKRIVGPRLDNYIGGDRHPYGSGKPQTVRG